MKPRVAISRCTSYDDADEAVRRCLALVGGMRAFVRPGTRVLVKINLVSGHDEQAAVTTHPALIAPMVRAIREVGAIPSVGDSPALVSAQAVARRAGLEEALAPLQVPIVDLGQPEVVSNPRAVRVKAFRLSARLREFDAIVSIPKLKTHCLVGMTAAVKNMFGCVLGKLKTAQHILHQDPIPFSEMLLDLHDTIPPQLSIVDGVVGQEGPGPGSGDPRRFGLVVVGASAVAVDTVCARLLGFSEREAPTVWLAHQRGLAGSALESIDLVGDPIGELAVRNLKKPRASATTYVPRAVMRLGKNLLTAKPHIVQAQCRGCADCAAMCSAGAIAMHARRPRIDYGTCIRCFCCQEVCPSRAIELRRPLLATFLDARR